MCEHAVLSGPCRRARAFHGGSRPCLLLQCASHLRRRSQAVLFSRRGRQRPGQVSDCLLPVEHFKSQEVIVWGRRGLSGNGLCGDGHSRPSGERSSPLYRHLLSACGKQPSPAPHDPSASLRADSQACRPTQSVPSMAPSPLPPERKALQSAGGNALQSPAAAASS